MVIYYDEDGRVVVGLFSMEKLGIDLEDANKILVKGQPSGIKDPAESNINFH